MSDDYMRRGKAQVLFNYLPNNTFDYTGGTGIQVVESIDGVELGDLDADYIGQQVLNKVHAWRQNRLGAVGFPQYPESFQLVEPREVETSLFPLMFRCTTCERVQSYDDTEELARYNGGLRCRHDGCNGQIQQHQFVFVHDCGEIRSPSPGKCTRCGSYEDWKFESYGSQRFRNAEWKCLSCSNTKDIDAWCDCDLDKSMMRLAVHRASSVFQPHHITVINIGTGSGADASDPRFAKSAVARYLGFTSDPVERVDLSSRDVGEDLEQKEWQLEQYREMYESSGAEQIQSEIERLEAEIEELDDGEQTVEERVVGAVPWLDVDKRVPDGRQQAVYDVYQYVNAGSALDRRTAREVILESGADTPQSRQRRELRADRVDDHMERLGIEELAFVEDFPMTNVVFGYTRINREPDDSRLVAFAESEVDSSGEGTPLFADTVETEAIHVSLRPERVLRWLIENSDTEDELAERLRDAIVGSNLPEGRNVPVPDGWDASRVGRWLSGSGLAVSDTEPLSEWDEATVRAWMISNVGEIPDYEAMTVDPDADDPVSPITYLIYHLVHTYSHLVLRNATQLSGMSRTSLAEFLMPRSLSFVVYSNQRTDFNIGGMYTLVESRLTELFGEVLDRGNDCVYDPVCSRAGAACHNCLFLSEVSCVHFNRNLGRGFLYGSKTATDRNFVGYLQAGGDQ